MCDPSSLTTTRSLDEAFKAAAWSWEVLEDPKTRKSGDPHASPFSRALKTDQTLWEFYERPEESFRQQRFAIGMHGVQALEPPDSILGGKKVNNIHNKSQAEHALGYSL